MMKKWHVGVLVIVVVVIGMWFAKIFPDPYHKNGTVNFYTWVYRELDELLHGEVEEVK